MKALLRTLLLWFLLAGVPFQGYASAAMLLCVPAAPATGHEQHREHVSAAHAGHHDGSSHGGGEHVRCGAAACCVGAPLIPALPSVPPRADTRHAPPSRALSMPASADLAGLDRPPKSSLA